jgi:hypothetical protein
MRPRVTDSEVERIDELVERMGYDVEEMTFSHKVRKVLDVAEDAADNQRRDVTYSTPTPLSR